MRRLAPADARGANGRRDRHNQLRKFLGANCAGILFVGARRARRATEMAILARKQRTRGHMFASVDLVLVRINNDPSAGSPTETLLRLLLPLNDKVQWTSRDVAGSEPPTSPRSEHFTGPFNR